MNKKTYSISIYVIVILAGILSLGLAISYNYSWEQLEPTLYYIVNNIVFDNAGYYYFVTPFGDRGRLFLDRNFELPFLSSEEIYMDGSRSIVVRNGNLWVVYTNSKKSKQLTFFQSLHPYILADFDPVVWSPNGKYIAFTLDPQLQKDHPDTENWGSYIINVLTGKTYKLPNSTVLDFEYIASNHSASVWFDNDKYYIYKHSIDKKIKYFIVSVDGNYIQEVPEPSRIPTIWAPNKEHHLSIFYDNHVPKLLLYKSKDDEIGVSIILDGTEPRSPRVKWSPDSNYFTIEYNTALTRGKNLVYLYSYDGKTKINIINELCSPEPGFYPCDPADFSGYVIGWSPDNTMLGLQLDQERIRQSVVYKPSSNTFSSMVLNWAGNYAISGWWPMIKSGPFGIPVSIIKIIKNHEEGILLAVIFCILQLFILILIYPRGKSDE